MRMSKDGVIVVCHDENFHRLCGPGSSADDKRPIELEYKEFPRFRDHLPIHFSKN